MSSTVVPLFDVESIPHLPDNLVPFPYQAGGHGSKTTSVEFESKLRVPRILIYTPFIHLTVSHYNSAERSGKGRVLQDGSQ